MKLHCIIHAPFEVPGYFEEWANDNNFVISSTHIYKNEPLPSANEFDFLLIMGGPQSPLEKDKYPYLENEIKLISDVMQQKKHVVGVCLGAQLIAESLGAKTERSPNKEIGVFPIKLTEAGRQDSVFRNLPNQFLVGHWHNDMPGVPGGAEIIASSEGCPRQIIRFNSKAYGFQCHMEFNTDCVNGLIENCPEDMSTAGKYIQDQEVIVAHNYDAMNQVLKLFLDHFVFQDENAKLMKHSAESL